jgi:hypothetical protein
LMQDRIDCIARERDKTTRIARRFHRR